MHISLFTDEVDQAPEVFLPFFAANNLAFAEIRMVNGRRIPDLTRQDLETLPPALKKRGIGTSALSPGLFKAPAEEGEQAFRKGLAEILPRTIAAAGLFDCNRILIFSPHRPEGSDPDAPYPSWLLAGLRMAAEAAATAGLRLCLENEPGTWADTGPQTRRLLTAVDHPHLRANWDPANAIMSGDTTTWPTGYRAIRPWVEHVHIKDAIPPGQDAEGTRFVPLGQGTMEWERQLLDLKGEGYAGFLTVETHCEPLASTTPACLGKLRTLLEGIEKTTTL